jgi:Tfp pilus assembly protein PilZ
MKIAGLARKARQSLGQGLEALQGGDAPERLLAVAQPLAKAMGMLVEMEVAPPPLARKGADPVLVALREGLSLLQLPENVDLPAAHAAMEHVAEALGVVHEISRSAELAPLSAVGKDRPASAAKAPTAAASAPTAAASAPTAAIASPAVAPRVSGAGRGAAAIVAPPVPGATPVAAGDQRLRAIEAALGAHSATNFYKGLASGDIVASGGLFVATYQVPPVGQELLLKVSMPGGYEFEARGVVAWTRDVQPSSTASGVTPGFGAQFSEISDEGRGLIQRYVRNREPLFHDDL